MWHRISGSQAGRQNLDPRRESGQIIIMIAFAAIALFAMVGLAIDAGRLYITKAELSRSVDAAALSGILEFNGTVAGLAAGEGKAEDYFYDNEDADNITLDVQSFGDDNEMTVDATKTVDLFFMSVLGIPTATVSAHARAGFGTQYLDTAMILDATPSMSGTPLTNAKAAAISFKNVILGSNPQGNALVGVTPFRGCFDPPMGTTNDCINAAQISGLSYNNTTLNNIINSITASTGAGTSATNVCTGLAKGWDILAGTVSGQPNHDDDVLYPGNKQVLILLSDGDNAYWGTQSYQDPYYTGTGAYNTSSSPSGTTVAGTVYPCQPIDSTSGGIGSPCPSPWNTPSIGSTYPCYKGVFSPITTIADDYFDGPGNACPSGWTSGSGSGTGVWDGPWVLSSSPAPSALGNTNNAHDTRCHIRLGGTASICRAVDLTSVPEAAVYFYLARNNWSHTSDDFLVEVSTDTDACTSGSASWSTAADINRNSIENDFDDYSQHSANLDPYVGQVAYVRFQGSTNSTSEYVYIDTITVDGGSSGSRDGYLNGNDSSNPANCNSEQKPRERQMDVRTLALANALKAQDVEIYVVAFAGGVANCYLGQPVVYDDTDATDCGLIFDPVAGSTNSSNPIGASGPDGYLNQPNTPNPNVRLLQCIASSTDGTADHYFYASDSDELVGIFTTIATQISHRLIE